MFKTQIEDKIWLVQQHHHAQVSGYLAAHWGGVNGFTRPGHFAGATDPVKWRDEIILGIAEHDNGWWEWEAMPRISDRDGLPVGVGDAAIPTSQNEFAEWSAGGFDRWRRGIDRLAQPYPYAALLVSLHAYWLYAVAFDDLTPTDSDPRRHFVFGSPGIAAGLVGDVQVTRDFLEEQAVLQDSLKQTLSGDPRMALAIEPQHLDPHVRLLQLLDSLSLYLSLNDESDHELHEVPRASWEDRCSIVWKRQDTRTITLDPYPFTLDPLPVQLPVRIVPADQIKTAEDTPYALLHGTPLETVEILLTSA
jgi:hypothetical protein